jgi:hypothetical protein|tara:strand:- start:3243 stop:4208 length:966 start_codon:yes stop_codon:yes gene_type:complete
MKWLTRIITASQWGREAAVPSDPGPSTEGMKTMASVSTLLPKSKPQAGTVHWLNEAIERGKKGVFTELVTVTPGLAGELLRRNGGNRGIKPIKASQYASDMAQGRWTLNGEPIIVADTGELNDGQHRMQGVIDANVSVPLLFVFGVSRESRKTVDQGAARTAGDYIAMDGIRNASTVAGLIRLLMGYEASEGKSFSRPAEFSNAEVRARAMNDADTVASADYAQSVAKYTKGLINPSLVGTCHYLLSEIHPGDALTYLNQVCIGEEIKRGDPAFAVRDALSRLEKGGNMPRAELIMRGWNAFRSSRRLTLAKRLGNLPALV